MRIIPDFNKYSEDYLRKYPTNLSANSSEDFERAYEDSKIRHNKSLDDYANEVRRRPVAIGKGIGVLGGGLVGGLTGNLVGRYQFKKKNPKDQFVENYLYENPLASKLEAEAAYNKLRKKALIKSSLLGAGLGAGVGYIGGSQIMKGIFNNKLRKAKKLGERSILNQRDEIINEYGPFGDKYNSISVYHYNNPDGGPSKREVAVRQIPDFGLNM